LVKRLITTEEAFPSRFETESVYDETGSGSKAERRRIARLEILWKQRRFLSKVMLGGLASSLTLALVIPPRFKSTVQLMPPDQQSAGLAALASLAGRSAGAGSLAGLAGDLLGQRTSGDLFIGVLNSRTVRSDLITKFDLRKLYGKHLGEDAARVLANRTTITEDRKSGVITISVSDRSPQRAAEMAQEYVNQLDWVMTELSTSSAHRERVFLEGRLQQVNASLEIAERNFSDFASRNTAVDIPEQGKAMVEAASVLEGQLITAQTELQGLREIYADDNVRVRAMQARIEELQRQVTKFAGNDSLSKNLSENSVDALYPSIRKLPLLGVQYADLLRTTKVQEVVFEALTQEFELAKVAEAKEIPSVKVLDPPNIAERKSFPPRRWLTIGGTLFIFGCGVIWILGTDRWQKLDARNPSKSFVVRAINDLHNDWRNASRKKTEQRERGLVDGENE
jgi:capsule polysaccharide export protein KpsE/RkpR